MTDPHAGTGRDGQRVTDAADSFSAADHDLVDVTDLIPDNLIPDNLIPDNLSDLAAAESDRSPSPGSSDVEPAADGETAPRTRAANESAGLESAGDEPVRTPTIWEQMGGPIGMVDSGLPVVVFIVANVIGGLGWGIGAALAAGVVIAIARIARRRPVTQAIAGLFGVGIAAYIAYRTDSAKG